MAPKPAGTWAGRRVLVTGHTGFKGAWLSLWLDRLGAEVTGLALPPEDRHGAFTAMGPGRGRSVIADLRDRAAVAAVVHEARPEVMFHLGAQALVRRGYADPCGTFATNVSGTAHVLEAAIAAGARAIVVVTSDKVYANDGRGRSFVETDRLGGDDPYSASKACAELVVASWRSVAPGTPMSTARAGNVIGGGDTAADRLLPDVARALATGRPVRLRHPEAVRPWQFVLEPLYGYLLLGSCLLADPAHAPLAVNFGPPPASCQPVQQVVDRVIELAGGGTSEVSAELGPPETAALRLDASEAARSLGWRPALDLDTALAWTVEWWDRSRTGGDLRALACDQVERYEALVPA